MTVNISIDTETWGKRPGCDGRSIGACVIDTVAIAPLDIPHIQAMLNGGMPNIELNEVYLDLFYIALDNPLQGSYSPDHYTPLDLDMLGEGKRRYYLHRDPSTVNWWHYDAPKDAQAAFNNPVDMKIALIKLSTWLARVGVNPNDPDSARIYGHGGGFDVPIIEAWYHACGLPVPWHYRAGRDTRSTFDMVEIYDHSNWIRGHQTGIFHHALYDSISQARALNAAFAKKNRFNPISLIEPRQSDVINGHITLTLFSGRYGHSAKELIDWVENKLKVPFSADEIDDDNQKALKASVLSVTLAEDNTKRDVFGKYSKP